MQITKEKATSIVDCEKPKQHPDLRAYLEDSGYPLLCVGPMSKNVVDAVIEFANTSRIVVPIIASRRQIECREFGGGYVNNWDTQSFANYVLAKSTGYTPLCRDHGGPWQGSNEEQLDEREAMNRAKISFLHDIANGFQVLHIDPSIRGGSIVDPQTLALVCELYEYVCNTAQQLGRRIEIEVGAEQQSGHFSDAHELVSFLKAITAFCKNKQLQRPLFCVVQTGTLVREMRNVGFTEGRRNESYDQKYAVENIERTIRHLADIAYINGVHIKEHNGDYLSDGSMALRSRLEVGAVNVAPELGVFESKCIITICHQYRLERLAQDFLQLFYSSNKWQKWLSADSKASTLDRAIMAGHYTFATPEFKLLRDKLEHELSFHGVNLDRYLISQLTAVLTRYSWNLGAYNSLKNFSKETTDATGEPIFSPLSEQGPLGA